MLIHSLGVPKKTNEPKQTAFAISPMTSNITSALSGVVKERRGAERRADADDPNSTQHGQVAAEGNHNSYSTYINFIIILCSMHFTSQFT